MSGAGTLLQQCAGAWWLYIVSATWQAAFVIAAVLILERVTRSRWSAAVRHGLLLVAALKLLTPPLGVPAVGLFSWMAPPAAVASGEGAGGAAVSLANNWRLWLMLLHGAGAVAVLAAVAGQVGALRRLVGRCHDVRGGLLWQRFEDVREEVGLKRRVRLLVTDEPVAPLAVGLWRPAVILPRRLAGELTAPQLRGVWAHELIHHQRGDVAVGWLMIGVRAMWSFNPLVWLLGRAVYRVREERCDDALLSLRLASGPTYCEALLSAARQYGASLRLCAALGMAESWRGHPLGLRLVRIMSECPRRVRLSWQQAAVLLIVAAVVLPGVGRARDAQPQELQSPVAVIAVARDESATAEAGNVRRGQAAHVIAMPAGSGAMALQRSVALEAQEARSSRATLKFVGPSQSARPRTLELATRQVTASAVEVEIASRRLPSLPPASTLNVASLGRTPMLWDSPARSFESAKVSRGHIGTRLDIASMAATAGITGSAEAAASAMGPGTSLSGQAERLAASSPALPFDATAPAEKAPVRGSSLAAPGGGASIPVDPISSAPTFAPPITSPVSPVDSEAPTPPGSRPSILIIIRSDGFHFSSPVGDSLSEAGTQVHVAGLSITRGELFLSSANLGSNGIDGGLSIVIGAAADMLPPDVAGILILNPAELNGEFLHEFVPSGGSGSVIVPLDALPSELLSRVQQRHPFFDSGSDLSPAPTPEPGSGLALLAMAGAMLTRRGRHGR